MLFKSLSGKCQLICLVLLSVAGMVSGACLRADITGDSKVNPEDFANMTSEWLTESDSDPFFLAEETYLTDSRSVLTDPSEGLVAHWKLDEMGGLTAYDETGNYNATFSSTPIWTTGINLGAVEFDRSYIMDCGSGPTPTTGDLTLAWWMVDNYDSYCTLLDKSTTSSTRGYNILLRPSSENSPLRFRIGGWQAYGGWGGECRVPQGAYSDGAWVHVVCTYDSATDTATIYINGQVPENGPYNPKVGAAAHCEGVNNPDVPLYVGGWFERFQGIVDDVRVYDRVLSESEIVTLWQSGIDNTAPAPNPMTWSAEPTANGPVSISMTATTASDENGVEYYFTCTSGNGHDSGWQDSPVYTDTGLTPETLYIYTVIARDKSIYQNETAASAARSATTTEASGDIDPPIPNPSRWASEPHAAVSYEVTMTAETATDPSGVEYYFACTSGAGHDSGWQDSGAYTDTGLSPNTYYTYTVKARDKSANYNETQPSEPVTVKTRTVNYVDSIMSEIEMIPIMVNGDKDDRINIVFLNRWFEGSSNQYNNAGMRTEFIEDINSSLLRAMTPGDSMAMIPHANYREFFNIYAAWWPTAPAWDTENPDGMDWSMVQEIRDRLFLPWHDKDTGWVTIICMPNGTGGGGGAGRVLTERVGDCYVWGNNVETLIHEFAHTAPSIADEYTSSGTWGSGSETYNTTNIYTRDEVKWRAWIDPTTPVPTPYDTEYLDVVGVFEGGQHRLANHFRSTARGCLMGAGVFGQDYICPICKQRTIMRAYKLANPIKQVSPAQSSLTVNGPETIHFSVDHLRPQPDTQQVQWLLNGKVIANNVDEIDVTFGELADYELVFSLTDVTSMIRPDPPYGEYPHRRVRWSITNTNPTSTADDLEVALICVEPGCEGVNGGEITANVSGGTGPYSFVWSTGSTDQHLTGVGEGVYEVEVCDSEFRHVKQSCILNWASTLTTDVRATLQENNLWQVVLNATGDAPLSYNWSNGATTETVSDLTDGTYGYTVVSGSGCESNGSITLQIPKQTLQVTVDAIPSTTGNNNGKILLNVTGGTAPYSYQWSDAIYQYGSKRTYQAEDASWSSPLPVINTNNVAGGGQYLDFNSGEGSVTWTVTVANAGPYTFDFIYASGDSSSDRPMRLKVNNSVVDNSLEFPRSSDTWTDWAKVTTTADLTAGENTITLETTGQSGPNLDYLSVPQTVMAVARTDQDRHYLAPGTYTVAVKDENMTTIEKTVTVGSEPAFTVSGMEIEKVNPYTVGIVNPQSGYQYRWNSSDTPLFKYETVERPVCIGVEFTPQRAGNYYVAAQKVATGAVSSNRIGFAISMDPAPQNIQPHQNGSYSIANPEPGYQYYWYDQSQGGSPLAAGTSFSPPREGIFYVTSRRESSFPSPVTPDQAGANLLLWLDASDVDGNGVEDASPPDRGALKGWKGKANGVNWGENSFVFYKPYQLNGKGVACWETIWLQGLDTSVTGYQTLIMVYKEHNLSEPGKAPFSGLNSYIGRASDSSRIVPHHISSQTLNGSVYLNGVQVDPLTTPNPMDYCVLTFQFASRLYSSVKNTDTLWEGTIAEFLLYDSALSQADRSGVEEYLRQKWLSAAHLESPRQRVGYLAGDLNTNNLVALPDLHLFVAYWLDDGCELTGWCHRADLNHDGQVDLTDYAFLTGNWLEGIPIEID